MSAPAEFAGTLRERVTLEYQAPGTDALGQPNGAWLTRGTHWAAVQAAGSGPATEAGHVGAYARYRVTLRTRARPEPDDRIIWRGRTLNILSVADDPSLPDRLQLLAEVRP